MGVLLYQSGGGVPPEQCKVSPGGMFSLGNFLFDERENYQV